MEESRFFNRELSWLEFNNRVLHQGLNTELPLLERLQFLSIVSSNFDEFFQVRVASVKRMLYENSEITDLSGLTPKMQLSSISVRAHQIIREQQKSLKYDVIKELAEEGLVYVRPHDYEPFQQEFVQSIFDNDIYPLITPLRTDTETFPNIKNLGLYVAYLISPISGISVADASKNFTGDDEKPRIALVEVPSGLKRLYWLPANQKGKKCFVLLSDILTVCGTKLFPGFDVDETLIFKVARDADFAVDEEAGQNFINAMENVLIQRKSSFAVQMTCNQTSEKIMNFLKEKLELSEEDVYSVDGFVDTSSLMELRDCEEAEKLSFEKWENFYPCDLPEDEPFWDTLQIHDKILHVPYESYDPVVKMLKDAADDPDVLAIKMTLYRTGRNSPIISALENAAENGKQVVVLVELKARFDEERNIAWANELEKAGVTVIYGLVNLKVHAKIMMIMRREGDSIRRYVHLSTGNYNTRTARLYSDISLFTANQKIANDATLFFNLVTGYSSLQKMDCLGMAPVTLKDRLLAMIQREADRSTPENPGLIMAKMNSLTHEEIINALYKASCAGVKILLNVRGICMLVPGVKDLSENIQVTSIVDRYLEHSRIFYFQNGGQSELYCSSADWMSRNLDRRIELMFPVLEKEAFAEVKDILDTYFKDNVSSQSLCSNGEWIPVPCKKGERFNAQEILYRKYKKRNENQKTSDKQQFIVRRK